MIYHGNLAHRKMTCAICEVDEHKIDLIWVNSSIRNGRWARYTGSGAATKPWVRVTPGFKVPLALPVCGDHRSPIVVIFLPSETIITIINKIARLFFFN